MTMIAEIISREGIILEINLFSALNLSSQRDLTRCTLSYPDCHRVDSGSMTTWNADKTLENAKFSHTVMEEGSIEFVLIADNLI